MQYDPEWYRIPQYLAAALTTLSGYTALPR